MTPLTRWIARLVYGEDLVATFRLSYWPEFFRLKIERSLGKDVTHDQLGLALEGALFNINTGGML